MAWESTRCVKLRQAARELTALQALQDPDADTNWKTATWHQIEQQDIEIQLKLVLAIVPAACQLCSVQSYEIS